MRVKLQGQNLPEGIRKLEAKVLRPPPALVSCCAPCSVAAIKHLSETKQLSMVVFYNPNISPLDEYIKRRDEQRRICRAFKVPFYELPYEPEVWRAAVAGLENEPERGRRCEKCFYMRLKKAAEFIKGEGISAFTSCFGVSRHKDEKQVARAGELAGKETGLPYLDMDFKSATEQKLRRELIRKMNIYRQNYCGCQGGGPAHLRPQESDALRDVLTLQLKSHISPKGIEVAKANGSGLCPAGKSACNMGGKFYNTP